MPHSERLPRLGIAGVRVKAKRNHISVRQQGQPHECHNKQDAGVENEAFWRFAVGWKRIDRLSPIEIDTILRHDLVEQYIRFVMHDAPLPHVISRRLDGEMISKVCQTPEQCRSLYARCTNIGDGLAAVEFWWRCLDVKSDLRSMIIRNCSQGAGTRIE
jgi:hypothetical protein